MRKNVENHISYSQIECGKCLFRYKKIYIDKEVENEGVFLNQGKVVHEAIKDYSKKCLKMKLESDYEVMNNIVQEILDKNKMDEEQKLETREILFNFAENVIDYEKILDFEKEFSIKLDVGTIEGVIDRINSYRDYDGRRVIEFIDYKNSFKIMSASEVEDNFQLRIYRYAGCNHLYQNNDVVRVGIHNTRFNFIRFGKFIELSQLSKEFERMEHYLNEQWKRLKESKEYNPERSEHCFEYGGCPVMLSGKCPLFSKEEIKRLSESDDIQDNVRAVRKLKLDCANLILKLKEYFKTNDALVVDGERVGFKSTKSYKYMLAGIIKFAKEFDLDIGDLTQSKTEVEKLVKKKFGKESESYLKQLEESIIHTASSSFEI